MDPHLQRLYRENTGPVAFLDESYRADGATTYYIVATALVAPDYLSETRESCFVIITAVKRCMRRRCITDGS